MEPNPFLMRFPWSIPQWRQLDSQIRSQAGKRHRLAAQFGALALSEEPSAAEMDRFQQRKGQLREEIQARDLEIDKLKQIRKSTPHHVAVKELPEEDRFCAPSGSTSSIPSRWSPIAPNPAWLRCCASIWRAAATMPARFCARSFRLRRISRPTWLPTH